MKHLRLPFFALLMFLSGLIFGSFLWWNSKQIHVFSSAQIELGKALQMSERHLVDVADSLIMDKTLAQNISWHLIHSVQGVLTSHLREPFTSDISLWGGDCKLIAKVGSAPLEEGLCPEKNLEKKIDSSPEATSKNPFRMGSSQRRIFWRESAGEIILTGMVRLPQLAENTWLLVNMRLHDIWLRQFPELRRLLTRHHYEMKLITMNGASLETSSEIILVPVEGVRTRILNFLADPSKKVRWEQLMAFFWGGAFLLWMTWIIQVYRERERIRISIFKGEETTHKMMQDLALDPAFAYPELRAEVLQEFTHNNVPDKRELNDCFQRQIVAMKKLVLIIKRIDGDSKQVKIRLEAEKDELRGDRENLYRELEKTNHLRALVQHQRALVEGIVMQFNLFENHLDDLLTTLEASRLCAKKQNERLGAWQQIISEKGSRKFIRSLAETPGSREGRTALDDQLQQVTQESSMYQTLTLAAATLGGGLTTWFESAHSLSCFWRDLLLQKPCDQQVKTLLDLVDQTQQWALACHEGVASKIEDFFTNEFSSQIPCDSGSQGPWSLFLGYVYHWILREIAVTPVHVVTSVRREGSQGQLAIRVLKKDNPGVATVSTTLGARESRRHGAFEFPEATSVREDLKIMASLLEASGIGVLILPPQAGQHTEQGITLICSWQVAASTESSHDLCASIMKESFRECDVHA